MPSPTSNTRPTSRASSLARNWLISDWRTETISSALNLMTASRNDLVPNIVQSTANRLVVDPVADPDDHAAEQVGIYSCFDDRFLLESLSQFAEQLLSLIIR